MASLNRAAAAAGSTLGRGTSPRTAQKRTSGDGSPLRRSSSLKAAGSRGRNSAHVARHRISTSRADVQRRIGARSPPAGNRPSDRSASPTTEAGGFASGTDTKYVARAARASGDSILPSAIAASRAIGAVVFGEVSVAASRVMAAGSRSCPAAQAAVAATSTSLSCRAPSSSAAPRLSAMRPIDCAARRRTSGCVLFAIR